MATCNPTNWVKLYADELYKFACSRVSDSGLAEDLVQDTFLSGLQAMHQFRGESSEKTWLLAILKNKINDHFRTAGRIAIKTLDVEDPDPQLIFFNEKGHWHKEMAPRPWTTDSNDKAEQADFFRILRTCMDKLTSLGKAVIQHKYLDEKKSADICKDFSLTSSNYWVIIHRARLQLRACLEKNWFSN